MTALTNKDSRSTLKRIQSRLPPPLVALILAVLLFLIGGLLAPGFANVNQAVNIVRLAAFLGIIAAGQTLVIISGGEGIDLSVGALVTLGAILTYRITDGDEALILPALGVILLVGLLIGLLNGIGVALLRMPPLVITLGMAGVVTGLIYFVTRGQLIGDTPPAMGTLLSSALIGPIPGVVILWLLLGAGMWLLLERTQYGKQLFAVGINRTAARLSGVRVNLVVMLTYGLSGMLAAFGGFVLLGFTQTVFLNLGQPFLFPSIAAVVVGGTVLAGGKGSYWGTIAGALVLQVINSLLLALRVEEAFQLIILGVILLVLLTMYGRQRSVRQ
ncbi:MAG: ABC transporter permease [Pleurocapsa minor GSE-CHR-MK-17-07R]|jgi:ribose transport system permease protein|nr:ABC transporter permease [Pleurocapsa minor GSE-CHR-MK 17-07R]